MGRLERKVAIVTGGAELIGGAAARLFAGEGARVVLVDRLMLFLASDDSRYCTGGVYSVDGGMSAI